ncbi:hypothetical protein ACFP76_17820 [Paracoccus aerius]
MDQGIRDLERGFVLDADIQDRSLGQADAMDGVMDIGKRATT